MVRLALLPNGKVDPDQNKRALQSYTYTNPDANDEAAAANAIRFKRHGSCEDFVISNLQINPDW